MYEVLLLQSSVICIVGWIRSGAMTIAVIYSEMQCVVVVLIPQVCRTGSYASSAFSQTIATGLMINLILDVCRQKH